MRLMDRTSGQTGCTPPFSFHKTFLGASELLLNSVAYVVARFSFPPILQLSAGNSFVRGAARLKINLRLRFQGKSRLYDESQKLSCLRQSVVGNTHETIALVSRFLCLAFFPSV
jgi:hypothetical protein